MGRNANQTINPNNFLGPIGPNSNYKIEELIDNVDIGVFKLDRNGKFTYVNNYIAKVTGKNKDDFEKISWYDFINSHCDEEFQKKAINALETNSTFVCEGTFKCLRFSTWCTCKIVPEYVNSNIVAFTGTITNITHIKQSSGRLEKLALQDSLTDLPNRRFFEQTLARVLETAKRKQNKFALLYLDLDNLKKVNDTFGHVTGDTLLKQVAQRLTKISRSSELLARLSGDEFTLIVENINSYNSIVKVINRIKQIFVNPFKINSNSFTASTSIGIAIYPDSATTTESLQQAADQALYKAKSNGKNSFEIFNDKLKNEIKRHTLVESKLQDALSNNEIYLMYQPQINVKKNKITAIEVLARWKNKELGEVPPNEFIPIAEESGKMHEIGDWILETAILDYIKFQSLNVEKFKNVKLSINISSIQLISHNLTKKLDHFLSKHNLDPQKIIIEINETSVMQNPALIKSVLENLASIGINVAIDEFGKGYSYLNSLNEFPIKFIKLNKDLVQGSMEPQKNFSLVSGMINLAKALNLKIVAVGIENNAQLDYLKENDCDYIQGYVITKPLNFYELEGFCKVYNKE